MSWKDDTTGVFQGSIFGFLIFLIHIDQLSEGLKFNSKPLADISLYSVVKDINLSQSELNENLAKIIIGYINGKWVLTLILRRNFRMQYLVESQQTIIFDVSF